MFGSSDFIDDIDLEIESNDTVIEQKTSNPAFIRTEDEQDDEETSIEMENDDLIRKVRELSNAQGLSLKVDEMRVVEYSSELLQNLDLEIVHKTLFNLGRGTTTFYGDLGYSYEQKVRFSELILKHEGYFNNEANYFYVNRDRLTEGTNLTTLRNSRVALYWRNVKLSDVVVKSILTQGFAYLIKAISYAELVDCIRRNVDLDKFELNISSQSDNFVLIGIEKPIFSF